MKKILETIEIKKGDFYKNKNVTKIDDIRTKYQFRKKYRIMQKIDSSTLLDTMMMMLADCYA